MLDNSHDVDIPLDQDTPQPLIGTTVYDAKGSKLGTVSRYDQQQAYFVMEKGMLFHKDVYVPLDAIAGAHEGGIRLYITKDDLHNVKWDEPPAAAATPTSDADILADDRDLRDDRDLLDQPPDSLLP